MTEHPFLICTREQFPALRARAAREPWASMRADALRRVAAGYDGDEPVALQRYVGAVALAYILEPDRQHEHADRVADAITDGIARVTFDPELAHRGTVPPMGAAFVSILALDVVYDHLDEATIRACEEVISTQIAKIDREGSWDAARYGTHGTWDIYRGDRTEPDDAFYENYWRQMTPDGVSTVANTYAFARLASSDDRPQKTAYADVLEFTGIDERYYENPRFARFYRWLYGHSVDPARQYYQFGDTIVTSTVSNYALHWRVGRFDRQAAAYAAWLLEEFEPPGHLLSYVLMDEPLPDPEVPQSELFPDGGAVFRERPDDPRSLGAGLYNITANDEWHSHEETNAIAVSAYGARVTVNGGWLGDETRPPARNNTIALDGERHETRLGGGLAEGLCTPWLDYAAGDGGDALPGEADFTRSLLLVHGRGDRPGYVPVVDAVTDAGDRTIHSYLQPATEHEPAVLAELAHYRATVDHHAPVEGVTLDVHYATEPADVSVDEVPSGYLERLPRAGHHQRMMATYPTDAAGDRTIVTCLVPADDRVRRPTVERTDADGATGLTLSHANGETDVLLAATGDGPAAAAGVTLEGRAALASGDASYFARRATRFEDGARGFESDRPVSIAVDDTDVTVIVDEPTELTLSHPDVADVRLDDRPIPDLVVEGDTAVVPVGRGRHTLRIYEDDAP